MELGEANPLFQRHLEIRWLILIPALQNIEQHWKAAKEYLMSFLPKQKDQFECYRFMDKSLSHSTVNSVY